MAIEGVDYTTTARPSVASLVAGGKKFACRYGGPGGDWKQIGAAEVAELTAAGVAIVANAEGTADGLKGGYAAGVSWARDADAHFRTLGMPPGRPIYLSADWDAAASWMDEIDAAMDGAASVLGRARVGVYGGYDVIAHLAANGKARWFWQTYAWSEGRWHPGCHIQQYRNGVTLGGGTVDLNRAMKADYGQWGADMFKDDPDAVALIWRVLAIFRNDREASFTLPGKTVPTIETNQLAAKLAGLESGIAALMSRPAAEPAPVDVAALRPELEAAAEAAVRRVLGAVDGATPGEAS